MSTLAHEPPPHAQDSAAHPTWRAPLLWRFLLRVLRILVPAFCRIRISGDIPTRLRRGPLIVVSNHIGTFDPFVLMVAAARIGLHPRFLATGGMFTAPLFGAIMRGCGHIRVDRGHHRVTDALDHATGALAEGSCIIIYPEGAITLDPGLWPQRGKTGAARLALASRAPVIPVAQWGAHEIMAWDQPLRMAWTLLTALIRRPVAKVHFGEPIHLTRSVPVPAPRPATDTIMRRCADLLPGLRPDEPHLPRHIDPVRPLSTAKTLGR